MSTETGLVTTVIATVKASTEGSQRVLHVGDQVFPGDIITTEAFSAVVIEFSNGQVFDLGRDSSALLEDSLFTPQHEDNSLSPQQPQIEQKTIEQEIAELQQKLADGIDVSLEGEATAAGPDILSDSVGYSVKSIDYLAPSIDIISGFIPRSLTLARPDAHEDDDDLLRFNTQAQITLSASDKITEDDSIIKYTATLDLVTDTAMLVNLSNGGSITIPAGLLSASIDFPIEADSDYFREADQNISVNIDSISGGSFNKVELPTAAVSTLLVDSIDSIFAILSGDNTVSEESDASYSIKLVDKDDNPITVKQDTIVTVNYSNISSDNGDTQYNHGSNITVTISANSSQASFTVNARDDYIADDGEKYQLKITAIDDQQVYENINYDNASITTTISDNSGSTAEIDTETVTISIVATDVNGIILSSSQASEGGKAYYKLIAKDPSGDIILGATGTANVTFTNDSAVRTGSAAEGQLDFSATNITGQALNTVFNASILDDYIADDGQTFKVSITNPIASAYETVALGTSSVTTKITDNSGTTAEANIETVTISIVATDVNGIILSNSQASEGGKAYYKLIAKDPSGDIITNATGTANVSFTDLSAVRTGSEAQGTLDFSAANIAAQTLNTVFNADILDDYIADDGQTFKVTISDPIASAYETVAVGTSSITTKITDNSGSTTEADTETVTISIVATDVDGNILSNSQAAEGGKTYYKLIAKDPSGDIITNASGTANVTFTDITALRTGTTAQAALDFSATNITAQALNTVFNASILDDYIADDGQTFKVTISNPLASAYETVALGTSSLISTIKDDSGTPNNETDGIESNHESVIIKLVAADSNGVALVDGGGAYILAQTVTEGGNGHYIALAFKPGSTANASNLVAANGTVQISFENNGATGAAAATPPATNAIDGTQDYNNSVQTITIGSAFSVKTFNDFKIETGEQFKLSITNGSYTAGNSTTTYENVHIDTTATITTINDGTPTAADTVIIKVFAATSSGQALKDASANYLIINSVVEGSDAYYVALAFAPNTTVFNDLSKLALQSGTVNFAFTDGTATRNTASGATIASNDFLADSNLNPIALGAVFKASALDDFITDNNESFTVAISNYTAPATAVYEKVSINTAKVTTTINDDISFGIASKAYVDESSFIAGDANSTLIGKLHDNDGTADADGNSSSGAATLLNVQTSASFNDYSLSFDNTIEPTLHSNGVQLSYDYSTIGKVTASAGSLKVFEIILAKHGAGGADDSYSYTQFANIDHPNAAGDNTINFDFGFKISNDSSSSQTQNFTITVNDSLPDSGPKNITLAEDASPVTIWLSNGGAKEGKVTLGDGTDNTIYNQNDDHHINTAGKVVAMGAADDIGLLKNNGDGSITFTANANYSGTPIFHYSVSDNDGDIGNGQVNLTVTPVADGATMQANRSLTSHEDNSWSGTAHNGDKDNPIALGLMLPTISDASDQSTGIEDAPERLSALTFTFGNARDFDGAVIKYDSDGNGSLDATLQTVNRLASFTIKISNVTDYHPNATTADHSLTKEQYQSIAIIPEADNANDIRFSIKAQSHEVKDNGDLYSPDIVSASSSQTVDIDVAAVTDPVTLTENSSADGTIDGIINITVNEDITVDLASLLTTGFGDSDGSEIHYFDVSGLVEGSKIVINGTTKTADSSGDITEVSFTNSTTSFTLTPPQNWDGLMNGITLTLKAKDTDADSTGINQFETASLTLNVTVTPVADDVTISTAKAASEDIAAFLFKDNSGNLTIKTTDTTGSSQDTITGVKILTSTISGTINGGTTPTIDGLYTVFTVADLALYKITPPAHSSADLTMTLIVQTTDGSSVINHSPHSYKLTVNAVAETVSSDSNGSNGNDVTINANHQYSNKALEDGNNGDNQWFLLGSDNSFNLGSSWSNEDDSVDFGQESHTAAATDSEQTYAHLTFTGQPDNGSSFIEISGAKYKYNNGSTDITLSDSGNGVDIPAAYLASLQVIAPEQFSGKVKIEVEAKTVDYDEDTGATVTSTTGSSTLSFKVDAVADPVTLSISSSARGLEDAGRSAGNTSNDGSTAAAINANGSGGIALDIKAKSNDLDGSETNTIIISAIPANAVIYYDGSSVSQSPIGTVTLSQFDNSKALVIIPPHNSDADFELSVKAFSVEAVGGSVSATVTSTIKVIVTAVADIAANDQLIQVSSPASPAGNGKTYQVIVDEDNGNTTNGVEINFKDIYQQKNGSGNILLASYDSDTSESLSIVVTGLDPQLNLVGATLLSGDGATRKWVFNASDVNSDSIKIVTEHNFSGEINFTVSYITSENSGSSKTAAADNVIILVNPDTEAVMTVTTNVAEDSLTKLNFTISSANDDLNESINQLWIKKSDVDGKQFDLFVDGTQLNSNSSSSTTDYYQIAAADLAKVTIKYDSDLGSSTDVSFAIKYTTKDSAAGIDNISAEIAGQYNLNLTAITDEFTIASANISSTNPATITTDSSGSVAEISLNGLGTFTADVNFTASSSDNGDADTDGSEAVTRLVIEGVPNGVHIDGGTYTLTSDGLSLWLVDIPDTPLNGSHKLTFTISTSLASDVGTRSDITITAYNQDGPSSDIKEATTQLVFIDNISGTIPEGTLTSTLSTKTFQAIEDTVFSLFDLVSINANSSRSDEMYSISLSGLDNVSIVDDSILSSYVKDGKTIYILSIGPEGNIETALKSVKFKPAANLNENDTDAVNINVSLTEFVPNQAFKINTNSVAINEDDLTPVTDAISDTNITANSDENTDYSFAITLNTVDDRGPAGPNTNGSDYSIIGNVSVGHSGVHGTLTWSGGSFTWDGTNSAAQAMIPVDQITSLKFSPKTNESGSVELTYSATTQEKGASNTATGGGKITLTIKPIADGLDLSGLNARGTEFTDNTGSQLIELVTSGSSNVGSATLSDSSESVQTLLINDVPAGFLVYIGEPGSRVLAQNAGDNGSGTPFNLNGTNVGLNTWSVAVEANGTSPRIWLSAPNNWSGQVSNLQLITTVQDGDAVLRTSTTFNLTVTAVASSISIVPTETVSDAYKWAGITLKADLSDIDGSETVTLSLKAASGSTDLDKTALFRYQDGTAIDGTNAVFDNSSKTWTLSGIASDKVNDIEILYHDYQGKIAVSAKTVDGSSTLATAVTAEFDLSLNATTTINLGSETGNLDIIGSSDDDIIFAGTGDDKLTGGAGNDQLTGGAGKDSFIWTAADTTNSIDSVQDFNLSAKDTIDLSDLLSNSGYGIEAVDNGGHLQLKVGVINTGSGVVSSPTQTIEVLGLDYTATILNDLLTSYDNGNGGIDDGKP